MKNSGKSSGFSEKLAHGNSHRLSDFPEGRSPEGKSDDSREFPGANFSRQLLFVPHLKLVEQYSTTFTSRLTCLVDLLLVSCNLMEAITDQGNIREVFELLQHFHENQHSILE